MNKKAVIAAAIAAVIGLVMLWLYMDRFEAEASGGAPVMILIARQDIPLGTRITKSMLGERPLPSAYVEERHVKAEDINKIVGVRVSSTLKPNEAVLWSDLATTSQNQRNLAALITRGMRAVTVLAGVSGSFGGLLRPGDRVDVLMTAERDTPEGVSQQVTIPLLQNILVLAVGRDLGRADDAESRGTGGYNQVTVAATVQQAQLLTFAQEKGRLSLTLRHPSDIQVLEELPETSTDDVLEPTKRAEVQQRNPSTTRPQTPNLPILVGGPQ